MTSAPKHILILDDASDSFGDYYRRIGEVAPVRNCGGLHELAPDNDDGLVLVDIQTVANLDDEELAPIRALAKLRRVGLVTALESEAYIPSLAKLGVFQVLPKFNTIEPEEIGQFIRSVRDPAAGAGLARYLHRGCEIHSCEPRSWMEKSQCIDIVINYMATNGFEIHELYNVRLIMEELLANAFFHAFKDDAGEEKYNVKTLERLDDNERVRIEYGHSDTTAGFSISDNAGTLPPTTILHKLMRQFDGENLLDESGRGIYLTVMLSAAVVINIRQSEETEFVVLFDDPIHPRNIPKPFMLNYSGDEDLSDCYLDPDFD